MLATAFKVRQRLGIFPKYEVIVQQQLRRITALYITGDKANQNYVVLQPYMDFATTLSKTESLEASINQRGLQIKLSDVLAAYTKYTELKKVLDQTEKKRDSVTVKLRQLLQASSASSSEIDVLKETGKSLRNDFKELKETFYPVEDKFVHLFLNLPNELHNRCPTNDLEKVLYRSGIPRTNQGQPHLNHSSVNFVNNSRYYLLKEAAEFDVKCTHALCRYFVDAGNFQQTANPDFVRCVLLEANATPLENYHLVVEEHLQNNLNSAYLCGGGAFESYLGAMTKLCVYPTLLPLRLISNGRSYNRTNTIKSSEHSANLFSAIQTNTVQTFVAAVSLTEADAQMEQILNLAVDFYKALGIHFRVVYADASELTISECLRAVIEVYSPVEQRYVSVGHVSHYSDYVAQRILFCTRQQKDYQFLHLVGGPVLYTSRLIAALIENGISLQDCKFLNTSNNKSTPNAKDEFKSIFQ